MTPSSQHPILSRAFYMPDVVDVVDKHLLAWAAASDTDGLTFRGGEDLLPAFLDLATAEPADMATFMETYGVPEICQHGRPDRHRDSRRKGPFCNPQHTDDGRPAIASADIRAMAVAFIAARDASVALAARSLPLDPIWEHMTRLQIPVSRGIEDWREGRAELARWITELLADCGATVVADWTGPRMKMTHEADGFLATLALLLARDLGQGDAFLCVVCEAPVERVRPPKKGERVYCDKPACRREQQRRNQAAWRQRKREEQSDVQ